MRKILMVFFLIVVSTITVYSQSEIPSNKKKSIVAEDIVRNNSSFSFYSKGLAFKRTAVQNRYGSDFSINLNKAVDYFKKSLELGAKQDLVYFHLAQCYNLKMNFKKAVFYANKSIDSNRKFIKSYEYLYLLYMNKKKYKQAVNSLELYLKIDSNFIPFLQSASEIYYTKLKDEKKTIFNLKKIIEISERKDVQNYRLERVRYLLGYIYYKNKKNKLALKQFEEVQKINSANYRVIYLLANLYMDGYDLDNAQKYASLFIKNKGADLKMSFILGRVKYIRGDFSAIHDLRKLTNVRTFEGIISKTIYFELKDINSEAEKLAVRLINYKDNNVCSHIVLAKVYLKQKKKEKAYYEFMRAAVKLYKNNLTEIAKKYLLKARELKKDDASLYYYLGRVYEDKNYDYLAIVNYKKANQLHYDVDLDVHIGYLYGMKKNYSKAFQRIDHVLKENPKKVDAYFFKALIYLWQKEYVSSERYLEKVISMKNDREVYYFYLAVVKEKLGKKKKSIESLKLAVKQKPESARSLNFLGYLYAEMGIELEQAEKIIKKALKYDPQNGAYLDSLGWVYYKVGRYELALSVLMKAEKNIVNKSEDFIDPVVYDHIGDTYLRLKKKNLAIEYWEQSVKYEKNSSNIERIKNKIKKLRKK